MLWARMWLGGLHPREQRCPSEWLYPSQHMLPFKSSPQGF